LILDYVRIQKVIPDPNCIKCKGEGVISTLGIGEYDVWIDSDLCKCVKFKDIELEEDKD
jgi:hypothetical protein